MTPAIAGMSPIMEYHLTDHAKLEMARRQITESEIQQVLSAPEQSELVAPGRQIYQSRITWRKRGKAYLLRVVVDIDREPPEGVTVYRTSKIDKYWRSMK